MKYILLCILLITSLVDLKIYEVKEFFDLIKKEEITKEDSQKLIDNLKKILERYVFLDIAKNPPQPQAYSNYFNIIDLIQELNNINTEKRSLYEFYRDIKAVICKCQDLHLDITLQRYLGSNIRLQNTAAISPVLFQVTKDKVYLYPNNNYKNYFDNNLTDIISKNTDNPVLTINGFEPLEYIQNFNRKFLLTKSPHAQFTINEKIISNPYLISTPFEADDLTNIELKYITNTTIDISYKILNTADQITLLNELFEDIPNNYIISSIYNYNLLKPKPLLFDALKQKNNNLKEVNWDMVIENGNLKCKVDTNKYVNVIYQSSFTSSNLEKSFEFFDQCFASFDNNNYPIVIIENFNGGGVADLANYFKSYLNINKPNHVYMSYRYNDDVKNNLASFYYYKDPETCKIVNGDFIFKDNPIIDDYGKDENGQTITHKRTKIFDISLVNEEIFYNYRKKAKNIRKPHEIIIFTDGYSYSATSTFIKGIQLAGAGIIVGYAGNPKLDFFDSSQSASSVISTEEINDNLSKEINNLGFSLRYTIQEQFSKLDYDKEENKPLEYEINLVDERAGFYNGYGDFLYDDFIKVSLDYLEKYKNNCNPKNKKLLFITEKCTFPDKKMHGGYECDDEGNWNLTSCIPSFCDNGYIFDERNQKCVEDICVRQRRKERKNRQKDKIYKILFIIFLQLFLFILILYLIVHFIGGFERKNYLFFPMAVFLILFVVFLILFLVKKEY